MPTNHFPYEDLSLANIKSERWKSIPGFEDLYKISSLGRVKSLQRERVLYHGGIQPIRERILKLKLKKTRNHSVDEDLYTLITTLYRDGQAYFFSVGRLVYYAFVASFDLEDKSILISYKDGDGRNLNYRNLVISDLSQLRNQSYEKGRYISSLRRPVSQFTVAGELVEQYASMYEAGRENNIGERAVAGAAAGGHVLYKGYIWQAGKSKTLKKGKLTSKIDRGINQALMDKAGIRIKEPAPIPVLNLSPQNMKGERWKDFPGYEGLYRISNFGRVKSLKKISEGKVQRWHPERIKQLTLVDQVNGKGGTLIATLVKDHKKKTFSIARYVYHLFVKSFNLKDSLLRVYYKDGDPFNLSAGNLMLKNAAWSIQQKL